METIQDTAVFRPGLIENRPLSRWYVLKTKPRSEGQCSEELKGEGFEAFCPMVFEYRHRRRRNERAALFPGYVFVRFTWPDEYHQVRWIRGVSCLVRFGEGDPPFVTDDLIEYFARHTNDAGVLDMTEEFEPDARVQILSEPFRGLIGRIVRANTATRRIVVLMEFLSQATVEIDACQLRAI